MSKVSDGRWLQLVLLAMMLWPVVLVALMWAGLSVAVRG